LTGCYSILIDKWTDYKKNILLKWTPTFVDR
jgi:hypothetical protein